METSKKERRPAEKTTKNAKKIKTTNTYSTMMDTDRPSDKELHYTNTNTPQNGLYSLNSFNTFYDTQTTDKDHQTPHNPNTQNMQQHPNIHLHTPEPTHNLNTITQHLQQYTNSNTHTPAPTQILFTDQDKGPDFHIIMEKENINEISTGQLLKKQGIQSVKEIKKTGKNRLKIILTNRTEANKIITSPNIARINNIKAFVPKNFIITVGIVKDVPLDLSVEEMLESSRVQGDVPINKIERMTFWDRINKLAKPSTNIKIEFRSSTLPREMFLFFVKKRIDHFIPKPTLCRKCLRYGHVDKICRAPTRSCINCCEDTHPISADCECSHCTRSCVAKCKYCKTEQHNTFNATCPHMKKQIEIKKQMITKNIDFNEAKQLVENTTTDKTHTTYASITSLTQQIETLKSELNKIKSLNQTLVERISSAEQLYDSIQDDTTETSSDETTPSSAFSPAQVQQIYKVLQEHAKKYKKKFKSSKENTEQEEQL